MLPVHNINCSVYPSSILYLDIDYITLFAPCNKLLSVIKLTVRLSTSFTELMKRKLKKHMREEEEEGKGEEGNGEEGKGEEKKG